MEDREYSDFDVAIEAVADSRYRVRVLDSPVGQARNEFTLPFSSLELENFLLRIGRPRRGVRRLDSPEAEAAYTFGRRLCEALFTGPVGVAWQRSADAVEREGHGLRLRLHLQDAPELESMPWEYLCLPGEDRFLVLSAWTPLVRYLELPRAPRPLSVVPPLRLLVMVSSPTDYPALDVDAEWAKVEKSLGPLEAAGMIALERLDTATLQELQRRLRREEYHIFHFIGHGGFDQQSGDGVLLLENEVGQSRRVTARDLGTILQDARSIRLAVLNSCEGARSSAVDPFGGAATSLVAGGVPAVVAMQFEITDSAAIAFAHELYAALADGYPIDASVGEARRAIFGEGNDVEWATPVLYMRSEDGRLFDIAGAQAEEPVDPPGGSSPVEIERPVEPHPDTAVATGGGRFAADGGGRPGMVSGVSDDLEMPAQSEELGQRPPDAAPPLRPTAGPSASSESAHDGGRAPPADALDVVGGRRPPSTADPGPATDQTLDIREAHDRSGDAWPRRSRWLLAVAGVIVAGVVVTFVLPGGPECVPQQVEVPSGIDTPWRPDLWSTGITVEDGGGLLMTASGEVDDNVELESATFGPDGALREEGRHGGDPWLEYPHAALIGRIGEGGDVFLVGERYEETGLPGGNLYLGVNDGRTHADNSGRFVVEVEALGCS